MKKEQIFLGEVGLTSTSANHVSNLAKEQYLATEQQLESVRLYNEDLKLIGEEASRLKNGWTINQLQVRSPKTAFFVRPCLITSIYKQPRHKGVIVILVIVHIADGFPQQIRHQGGSGFGISRPQGLHHGLLPGYIQRLLKI